MKEEKETLKFNVTGMSCAACQARVEKAVNSLPGVSSCAVSLITASMSVSGNVSEKMVIEAVTKAGYGASVQEEAEDPSIAEKKEVSRLKRRLFISLGFLIVLMYISMGRNMLGFPVPSFLENPIIMGTVQGILALVVLIINRAFFISGTKALLNLSPNMDTLVCIGSGAAFLFSILELIFTGDIHKLYFESSAMIPCLITVGKLLEAISKGRTTDALKDLFRLAPETANVITPEGEKQVPAGSLRPQDICLIRPGEKIPADGVVIAGSTAVNESALTGESMPKDKTAGDRVYAGTINTNGTIKVNVQFAGNDTSLAKIIRLVSDAAATKAPIARIADRAAAVFVPVVMAIAVIAFAVWMITGKDAAFSIARAVSVLVISCPCALGLATPVAIMAGSGVAARKGILFKTAASLEMAGKCSCMALDKTGTITMGKAAVTDAVAFEDGFMEIALGLESRSEHPLGAAITAYCIGKGAECLEVDDFEAVPGKGVRGLINGKEAKAGSEAFVDLGDELKERVEGFAAEGKTTVIFEYDGKTAGIMALSDEIKEDSKEAVSRLKKMGIKTVMLTGDNRQAAAHIAADAGVDEFLAEVMPEDKEKKIRALKRESAVIMVGDGINDAPALVTADVGIAVGNGTDVAIESADVVVMKSSLADVAAAVCISRRTISNIKQNLFWAFFYNIICIPLAAGFYQAIFGWTWEMSPMIGAACMCISSFTVCLNALRLNLANIYDDKKDKPLKVKKKKMKEISMEKTLIIEGMMCPHCEAAVKKALEAIDDVESVEASHTEGKAEVKLISEVPDEVLKKAVEDKDYQVLEIR